MECRLAGETEVLGENLPKRHFCPSQNPTWPDPGLNPGRRGGSRRLTAWAMARPLDCLIYHVLVSGKTAAGLRQQSHSLTRDPRNPWPYFSVSQIWVVSLSPAQYLVC
jgi:hypothetical protein